MERRSHTKAGNPRLGLALGFAIVTGGAPLTLSRAAAAGDINVSAKAESVDPPPARAGTTDSALPGIIRLGLSGLRTPGQWSVFAGSGYGMTESQGSIKGSHHRLGGSLAVGFTPAAGVDISLRVDGRRDAHPSDAQGFDTGYVGEPTLTVRYGHFSGDSAWSAELGARVPGREAPSLAFDAAAVDAKGGFARRVDRLTLAAMGGFRLDRSGEAKPNLALTRRGDRVSLGLSDFNAALLGVGVAYQLGATELLGELSADLLLGGPSLSQSPMRLGVGIRHRVSDNWQVFAMLESSPSARPNLAATAPLIPVEPRVSGRFGLAYAFGSTATDATGAFAPHPVRPADEPPASNPAEVKFAEDPVPDTPSGQLRGLIRSFKGQGLRATVRVDPLGLESQTDEEGAFTIDVPPATYQVQIVTKGFRTQTREVRVEENGVTVINADLRRDRGSK